MRQLLLEHLEKYPLMQPQDCVKLFYQSRMGCGHFLSGSSQVQARLQKEYQTCPHTGQLLFESLGHDYCRLHLSAFDASELSLETLGNLFVYSSQQPSAGENALKEDLLMFDTMVRSKESLSLFPIGNLSYPSTKAQDSRPSATATPTGRHIIRLIGCCIVSAGTIGRFWQRSTS